VMKFAPNYFYRGQLRAMFVLFPDPHFKRSNHRRRVITANFLALYAYCMRVGGKVYLITDVLELFEWMVQCMEAHPLFERVVGEEMDSDPCVALMSSATEEGKKVTRLSGNKYPAVFRRIEAPAE
jgi:tRNA (guanine-N7-)-methyltransferase